MQHWADRIDHWLDPKEGDADQGGRAGLSLLSSGWLMLSNSTRGKLM
jgi:hypothetical protein